ncbi:MAG: hypothetical protein WCJ35_10315 [Planctomycetota bacterium]
MAKQMTVAEFKQLIADMAQARVSLEAYCDYLQQKKYLREEHLAILAVVNHKAIPGTELIELGNEREAWDARVGGKVLYEVVQALPKNEYEIRKGGQRTVEVEGDRVKIKFRGIASGGASTFVYHEHASDHLQFPDVIVEAIESKHRVNYTDSRSLVVVVSGDYTSEDDAMIARWIGQQKSHESGSVSGDSDGRSGPSQGIPDPSRRRRQWWFGLIKHYTCALARFFRRSKKLPPLTLKKIEQVGKEACISRAAWRAPDGLMLFG